jgi:hypothetical protein
MEKCQRVLDAYQYLSSWTKRRNFDVQAIFRLNIQNDVSSGSFLISQHARPYNYEAKFVNFLENVPRTATIAWDPSDIHKFQQTRHLFTIDFVVRLTKYYFRAVLADLFWIQRYWFEGGIPVDFVLGTSETWSLPIRRLSRRDLDGEGGATADSFRGTHRETRLS